MKSRVGKMIGMPLVGLVILAQVSHAKPAPLEADTLCFDDMLVGVDGPSSQNCTMVAQSLMSSGTAQVVFEAKCTFNAECGSGKATLKITVLPH